MTGISIRQATLLTCAGVRNQTHNDRHWLTYWDIPEVHLHSTYPGQLGRSRVLRRLSPRICPSSAGKSFGIVSRAKGWYKFGMCTGRGGVRVTIEQGLYRRTHKIYWTCHNPCITGLRLSALALITWAGPRRFQVRGPPDGINFNRNHNLLHRCMSPDQPRPNLLRTSGL